MTIEPGQAAPAAGREVDHLVRALVADEGADRAERLYLVRFRPLGVLAAQQQRRDERAAVGARANDVDVVRVTEDQPTRRQQRLDRASHLFALLQAGQRAHLDALLGRGAHHHGGQLVAHGLGHLVGHIGRDEGPPDRGALLAGLDGHLGDQLADVQVELRRAGLGVRAEDGAVQRVRLGVEPDRPAHDDRVRPQLPRGRGRPGERHQVLLAEVIEQPAGAAADELKRSRG